VIQVCPAMMFSFLETMRLQGKNAAEELFKLLAGSSSPHGDFSPVTSELVGYSILNKLYLLL
jgi:hypothetical protein